MRDKLVHVLELICEEIEFLDILEHPELHGLRLGAKEVMAEAEAVEFPRPKTREELRSEIQRMVREWLEDKESKPCDARSQRPPWFVY